jgi:cell division protease FtsH
VAANKVTETGPSTSTTSSVFISLLPLMLLVGFYVWMLRRTRDPLGGAGGGPLGAMGAGRSKAKVGDAGKPSTRCTDISRPRQSGRVQAMGASVAP